MIHNYIFDFGNVLAEFHPEKLTAPFIKDEELRKKIAEIVFDRLYWDKLDDGSITDEEVREGIRSRVLKEYSDVACEVYDNWVQSLTPISGMTELIADLKNENRKLYLLSNISIGFAESYKEVIWIRELLSNFDGLVFSGPIGLIKPDKAIFEHLLRNYDLTPEDCLFIDDSSKNIEGAKQVGIQGYLFDGDAEKLRSYLRR